MPTRFTKRADDWQLSYSEEYNTRAEAVQREREIKARKSRKYIEELVSEAQLVESRLAGFTPSRL